MAQTTDVLSIFTATRGNQILVKGREIDLLEFEPHFKIGFATDADQPSTLRYGKLELTLTDWFPHLKERGALGFWLADGKSVGAKRKKPSIGGQEIEDRMLHAFVGSPGLLLGVRFKKRVEMYRPSVVYPRRTDLTIDDLVAFIDAQKKPTRYREALLWQDKHNLKITDGSDWDAFIDAITEAQTEEVIDAFSRSLSNVKFTDAESDAWYELCRKRANKRFAPHFRYVKVGEIEPRRIVSDVAAQAAKLEKVLTAIHKYAAAQKLDPWHGIFKSCLDLLHGDVDLNHVPSIFKEDGLTHEAHNLISAAMQADVFGGMGSWNDMGMDDEEYPKVSEALFAELHPSLEVAVNSFWAK